MGVVGNTRPLSKSLLNDISAALIALARRLDPTSPTCLIHLFIYLTRGNQAKVNNDASPGGTSRRSHRRRTLKRRRIYLC